MYFREVGKSLIRLLFCLITVVSRLQIVCSLWESGTEHPPSPPPPSQLAPCSIGMSCPVSKDGEILLYLPHRGVVRNNFMSVVFQRWKMLGITTDFREFTVHVLLFIICTPVVLTGSSQD